VSALLILLLLLPVASAFGVSAGALKLSREVIVTRRPMFGAETTAIVAEATAVATVATVAAVFDDFLHVFVAIAVHWLGGCLMGSFLGYLATTPSIGEIRSEMHNTNKRLEGLQTKLQSLNTKLQSRNPKKF
jgi:hypothetical protein